MRRTFLVSVLLALATLGFAAQAGAVDGFQQLGLMFGMTPEQVRELYPDQLVHDPAPAGAPEGTIGGRLIVQGDRRLFDDPVEVSCFFTASGLSIIRMQFDKPARANLDELLDFYQPHWGEPIRSIKREGARKKITWSWPWEGVQLRAVEEGGAAVYQRVDFSEQLKSRWTRADALLCKLLPGTSSCPFADGFCPQQDGATVQGQRTQRIEIDAAPAEVSCTYQDYVLQVMRLRLKEPDDRVTDWLLEVLTRRLGPGVEKRTGDSSRVVIDTVWADHEVALRVVRLARVKTEHGWTGPVDYVRLERRGP